MILSSLFRTQESSPKKLRAVPGHAAEKPRKPQAQEIHYETGSSCTESEDDTNALIKATNDKTVVVERNPAVVLSNVQQKNREEFPERKDVANTRTNVEEISKRLTDNQKFYQLLSTIKGENVKVGRLDEVEKQRAKLPIHSEEQVIVETINDNTV